MTKRKSEADKAIAKRLAEQAKIRALRGKMVWQGDLEAMRRDD